VPYDGLDPADIRSKVEKEEPMKMPYGCDQRVATLIGECRQVNIAQRPSFQRIVDVLNFVVK